MAEARTPPHSMQAEQSVLGALLMDNAAMDDVAGLLQPGDFYAPAHAAIYSAVQALVAAGQPADVVTVFERSGHDLAYLNDLASSVASARNVRSYAAIVKERATRRQLMRLARQLEDEAISGIEADAPVLQLVDRAVGQLMALQQQAGTRDPVTLPTALAAFVDDLTARYEGRVKTFPVGLAAVDRLTADGGRRGELWVIGARPSMGKTAFVLQLCRAVGLQNQVLLCSQEDSILSASARFVAAQGRVNLAHLRAPATAPDAMWDSVTEGVEGLSDLHVMLDDQAGLTLADVRRKGQQVKRKCGRLDLLVVDYLQLMDDGGGNRSQGLGYAANGLKALAKELDCWIVLLSQLSRKADERNGPPQMSDLRDSGDIEGAADLIGMLHREYMRKPTEENKHWAQFHIPKQKNGPTGTADLYFDGAYQRFSDWDGPAPKKGGGNGAH